MEAKPVQTHSYHADSESELATRIGFEPTISAVTGRHVDHYTTGPALALTRDGNPRTTPALETRDSKNRSLFFANGYGVEQAIQSPQIQLPLPDAPRFDGTTYLPWRDDCRLVGQMRRVWDAMVDGRWYTPEQLEALTGDRWASISAQQRHLRKDRFGAHTVEKRHTANSTGGSFEYRLIPNPDAAEIMAAAEKKSHHRGSSAQPANAGAPPPASRAVTSERG